MKTRIVSALILLPLLGAVVAGGTVLKITGFIISVIMLYELFHAFKKIDIEPVLTIGIVSCTALYIIDHYGASGDYYMSWIFLTMFLCTVYSLVSKNHNVLDSVVTFFGVFYVVFLPYHVIIFDDLIGFESYIWLIFTSAFITDSAAYFSGMLFGKHKLMPEVSPKKTIEGAIGGVVGSLVSAGIIGYFVDSSMIVHFIIIGTLGSLAGQMGDLIASAIKRKLEIKDFSNLIPGHGGVLDRFDSVLFTAPVVYYYVLHILT